METDVILQAISTVGFPIVCCGCLFWQNNKLSETIGKLQVTLAENTLILKQLSEKLKGE